VALSDLLGIGNIVFDFGANVGYYTVFMSYLVGENGYIHAFEPNPICLPQLKKNLRSLKNVNIVESAVIDTGSKMIDFYLDKRSGTDGVASSITPEWTYGGPVDANHIHKIRVPAICLDDYCKTINKSPNLVKLDVEGSEILALRGFSESLEKYNPHIILEYNSDGQGKTDTAISFLEDYGYNLIDLSNYMMVLQPIIPIKNYFAICLQFIKIK
jgi:FkbM family methyltransferase